MGVSVLASASRAGLTGARFWSADEADATGGGHHQEATLLVISRQA
jgi:hypothetical protein